MKQLFLVFALVFFPCSLHALAFAPPVLFIENYGNCSWCISPGLGFDSISGITFGCDFEIDQHMNNWNFSTGFGAGYNFLAVGGFASCKGKGAGFYTAHYGNAAKFDGQPHQQMVGGLKFFGEHFAIRFENDFLFQGDKFDRWRTVAVEIDVYNFVLGTYVFTNMPHKADENYQYDENYRNSIWKGNRKAYSDGEVYHSVFYVGYRYKNRIIRVGINHPIIQDIVQNGWHTLVKKPFFHTPYGQYFSPYIYIGYYNPFSLYGK